MKPKRKPYELPFLLAGILLVLTLFSISISSRLFARYTVSASPSDSARIAVFKVEPGKTYTTADIPFGDMAPGESKAYTFEIKNTSEVAVGCTASLISTGDLPLTFDIQEKNGSQTISLVKNSPVRVLILSLAPNQTKEMVLTANWPSDANDLSYLYEVDAIQLTIVVDQKD